MATCYKCGKLNYAGVKICTACGTPLPEEETSSYASDNEELSDESQEYETNDQSDDEDDSSPAERKSEKKGKNKKLLIILISVAVVLILGVVLFFILSGNSDSDKNAGLKIQTETRLDSIYVDSTITFFIQAAEGAAVHWQIKDSSAAEYDGAKIQHMFQDSGRFWIYALIDQKVVDSLQIRVKIIHVVEKLSAENIQFVQGVFKGAEGDNLVLLGKEVILADTTPGATKFGWNILCEDHKKTLDGNKLKVIFNEEGECNIAVNNDRGASIQLSFYVVKPEPVVKKEEPKKDAGNKGGGGAPAEKKEKEPVISKPKEIALTAADLAGLDKDILNIKKKNGDVAFDEKYGADKYKNISFVMDNSGKGKDLQTFISEVKMDDKIKGVKVDLAKSDLKKKVIKVILTK
jgi:hypothetical protein